MDNCLISCQVMADMKKVYDDLIIVNLYLFTEFKSKTWNVYFPFYIFGFLKSVFLKYVEFSDSYIVYIHTYSWKIAIKNSMWL